MTSGEAAIGGGGARFRLLRQEAQTLEAAKLRARQSAEDRQRSAAALASLASAYDAASGFGPGTWMARLTGRLSERRQRASDALAAHLATHQRVVTENEAAVTALAAAQAARDALPTAREEAVADLAGPEGARVRELLQAADRLSAAVAMTHRAFLASAGVEDTLESAEGWSTYDLWLGGGMVASAIKQDTIYAANEKAFDLTEMLNELRAELQNLGVPSAYFSVQMNDWHGSDTADVFFDTLLSDYIVHRRVQNSLQRVDALQQGLHQLGSVLGHARQRLLDDIDDELMRLTA